MTCKCEVKRNTRVSRNLGKVEEEPSIKSEKSVKEAFIRKSARFNNLAEALKEDSRKIEFTEDIKNSRTVWDGLIRSNTKYDGWDELCKATTVANV